MKYNKARGFTLLEVLMVVIIIGILASTALPQYLTTIEKAKSTEAIANIGSLRVAMERYWFEQIGSQNIAYIPAAFDRVDIDNPNINPQRLYNYYITDRSSLAAKNFIITAERIGKETAYWLKWIQLDNYRGKFYRSKALGGPES